MRKILPTLTGFAREDSECLECGHLVRKGEQAYVTPFNAPNVNDVACMNEYRKVEGIYVHDNTVSRIIDFTIGDGSPYVETETRIRMTVYIDGTITVDAERDAEYAGYPTIYEEVLTEDPDPTVAGILFSVDAVDEARWDAAMESQAAWGY